MNPQLYARIVDATRRFNSFDLLNSVAALQLMPVNVSRTVRLEVLAHAVAGHPVDRHRRTASRDNILRLCNADPLASLDIVRMEDPPEWHFTEPFAWAGRPFVVFPGISDDSTFSFRHLAKAVDIPPEFHSHPEFITDTRRFITAVLRLSSEIARRAGLPRGTLPRLETADTVVPALEDLEQLKRATVFREAELDDLLRAEGGHAILHPLVAEFGSHSGTYDRHSAPLLATPLLRHDDSYIAAFPGLLLDAARHRVLSRGSTVGVIDDVGRRFSEAVWSTASDCLGRLDMAHSGSATVRLPDIPNSWATFWQFDADKCAQVLLVTDPFRDYRLETVFGRWPLHESDDAIAAALHQGTAWAARRGLGIVTNVVIVQGAGREHQLGLDDPPSSTLALRAAELETISYVEGGQSLALWKFVNARNRFRGHTHVQAASLLDEFEAYRSRKHTFYFSDDAPPDFITFEVGTALDTRRFVADRYDPHAEIVETGTRTSTLVKTFDKTVPIYGDIDRAKDRVAFFVAGLPLPAWVVSPQFTTRTGHEVRRLYLDFIRGISYWLWQFTPALREHLRPAAVNGRLIIRLELDAHILDAVVAATDDEAFEVAVDGSTVALRITRSAVPLFSTADNRGERALMTRVLSAIARMEVGRTLDEVAIARLVDQFAPLGAKKEIFLLRLDRRPELDPRDLLSERLLQEADIDGGLLDDLGEHLREAKGWPVGPIQPPDRDRVLHDSVEYFYELLRAEAARMAPNESVEMLMRRHEALIQQTKWHALTVPTRLACYADVPDMVATIEREMPERARAALASRFLVEYCAACPPRGHEVLSVAAYDRLLAIAHHVINLGFASELLHFGLADTQLAILGSGRLGIERDVFADGLKAFMSQYSADVVRRSTREFERHWDHRETGGSTGVLERFEAPSRAEFGASLREFLDLMAAAIDMARLAGTSVMSLTRRSLIERLTDSLAWPEERVESVVGELVLSARDNFLQPPSPFQPRDVYPWKFSRGLSYLRRPFIEVRDAGEQRLLWGFRHTFQAMGHVGTICAYGRLTPRTPEMRSAISQMNDERGAAFNETVAQLLQREGRVVQSRVSKFGQVQMPRQLGDVDVLVVEPQDKCVLALECKDLALARTPHELANQLEGLMRGADRSEGRTTVRHGRRLEWLRGNLAAVLTHFGVASTDGWQIRGAFVVDEPLFVAHLRDIGMPVVSIEALRADGFSAFEQPPRAE